MSVKNYVHHFHIPVMGTAFTIDTPYKVARFGIASVVSIGDDVLCETMRAYYSNKYSIPFEAITPDSGYAYRQQRITAYLNLLQDLIDRQIASMKTTPFLDDSDNTLFFKLLPDNHPMKIVFNHMCVSLGDERAQLEQQCRAFIQPGPIDVNIMTKLDRNNYDADNNVLPDIFSDAVSALRGFAESRLEASVVFSAGFNRRLFAQCAQIDDFFFVNGAPKKQIILKVSDFRSSQIQGRFLAKKGVFISEYRVESGLNCGGHAFATEGLLCGPILDEFKHKLPDLVMECRKTCNHFLEANNKPLIPDTVDARLTYQGGLGTHAEHQFLMDYYGVHSTGWATPFLLVPQVTTVDVATRTLLQHATESDCYLSEISPLGVPFNTIKNTQSEVQKMTRVAEDKPGSPCPKGYLVSDTEFSKKPVCKASIFYQKRKIMQLKKMNLLSSAYDTLFKKIIDKACLCEDLAAPALLSYGIESNRPQVSAVCPGPNIAYFNKIMTLKEMVDHIYGRVNVLMGIQRPHFFISELRMYVQYLKKDVLAMPSEASAIDIRRLLRFANNLRAGIRYYIQLFYDTYPISTSARKAMVDDFKKIGESLDVFLKSRSDIFASVFNSCA
jgi:hypothetical protein